LRARLVAIIVLLLALGLVLAALATRAVVSNYLVDQMDEQLKQAAREVTELVDPSASGTRIPSEYVLVLRDADGATSSPIAWQQTIDKYGTPLVPDEQVAEAAGRGLETFTTGSTGGVVATRWRVVSVPVLLTSGAGTQEGTAYVALPLAGVEETVAFLSRSLLASGVGIVVLGGLAAYLLVHRSLRPLRRIESTAAAIAAGDLSQRIPPQPASTEVGSLAHSLNTMLAQIEQAFAVQEASEARMRRFVSDASHELRTPLATIKGYGELYRMGALDTSDKVEDTMGRIEDSARRMGTLVNDLLVLARLDEGRPMRHEPVDVVAIARDAAQDLHALDPTRTVSVTGLHPGDAAPSGLVVTGDADRLRQVLTNLVGNVARHTPAGSPAEIALGTTAEGQVCVEVRDHGPGVSAEQAGKIFERFYRADSSRNRGSGGSGLGLAIVAAIVGAHHGHVGVAETPGGGLTVRVLLPAGPRYDAGSSSSR
ncbi:HAMP domain-containing sensor histidine kinase, partial [Isoptericola variabilis]